jgi:hypothetical protein
MHCFTFSGAELLAPLDEDVPEVPGRDGAPPLHVHRLQQTEENSTFSLKIREKKSIDMGRRKLIYLLHIP